jgi:type II secretory pathway component GspD/PulD (secretin)
MNRIILIFLMLALSLPVMAQNEPAPPTSAQNSPDISGSAVIDVLDLKSVDILDVLKLISQKSGMNIISGQNVSGKISVYLKDIAVEDALRIIVEANGLAYERDGQVIKVVTAQGFEEKYGYKFGQKWETRVRKLTYAKAADIIGVILQMKTNFGKVVLDEKSNSVIMMDEVDRLDAMEGVIQELDIPIKTEVFNLSYATAEDISGKISEILTTALGRVRHDVRSNTLVVSDTESKLKEVRQIINAFDQRHEEVLIEAKILQIVLNDEHSMGVDWEGIVADYHMLNLAGDFDILAPNEKRGTLSVGTIDQDNYSFLIEALDTVGTTDILSSPSITAINNKEAKILVGSSEPYVTSTTTTPSSGPTTTAETINFIEVGVKLYVTPTIHKDSFITMKIKPEVSSVVNTITTGSNNTIPVVETSEAETTVMVKDGITIVIGGLIKEQRSTTTKKIPMLGNIPLLGTVFKSSTDSISKTEIVIFLTPKLISGDVPAQGPAVEAALYQP